MRTEHFLFLIILLFLAGCIPDKFENPYVDESMEYYPLSIGRYITYQVDSIVFDDAPGGNKKDTVSFQLREQIVSKQLSGSGDTLYYMHRFRRNLSSGNWTLTDVWTAAYHENQALLTQENLTFRKMNFPLRQGLRWTGTVYINPSTSVLIGTENVQPYEQWDARVNSIDKADQVGDFTFPEGQVMTIRQTETDDDLMKRYVYEKYARGIGLVSRIDTILDSRCIDLGEFEPCIGKAWVQHASKGYILSQVMIEHN